MEMETEIKKNQLVATAEAAALNGNNRALCQLHYCDETCAYVSKGIYFMCDNTIW